jgi:hypothetical protein
MALHREFLWNILFHKILQKDNASHLRGEMELFCVELYPRKAMTIQDNDEFFRSNRLEHKYSVEIFGGT